MKIELSRATVEESAIVKRLLQLYLHDYTSCLPLPIGDDGLFAYEWQDQYWSSPSRHPYLVRFEGRLAGFVLVREREEGEAGDWRWQIAEFFILRALRGKGIGTMAALEVIQSRPGLWEISYDTANDPAPRFWASIVYTFDPSLKPESVGTGRERFLVQVSEGN